MVDGCAHLTIYGCHGDLKKYLLFLIVEFFSNCGWEFITWSQFEIVGATATFVAYDGTEPAEACVGTSVSAVSVFLTLPDVLLPAVQGKEGSVGM